MGELVNFEKAGLPSGQDLGQALTQFSNSAEMLAAPGEPILKLSREGVWMYGQEQIEVEDDSQWAVNTYAIQHGLVCWGDGSLLGEKNVSFTAPLPPIEEMPQHTYKDKKGREHDAEWTIQYCLQLKCVSGEDEGVQVIYKTNSVGGKRAVQKLIEYLSGAISEEPTYTIPIVELEMDHYNHKQYGKTYTPEFNIVDMVSPDQITYDDGDDDETEENDPDANASVEDPDEDTVVETAPKPEEPKAKRKTATKKQRAAKKQESNRRTRSRSRS